MDELLTRLVFIDTCIYENKNFQFLTYELAKMMQLCEENKILLLSTDMTCHEVERHIEEHSLETARLLKKAKDDLRLLRNTPQFSTYGIFKEKLTADLICSEIKANFKEFLESCNVKIISSSKASIEEIVENYIHAKPPFSIKKKEEFPDAITLSSLKGWAREIGHAIYIISSDADMKAYCDGETLISLEKIEDILDLVIRNEAELNEPVALIDYIYDQLKSEINIKVEELVLDANFSADICSYPDYVGLVNLKVDILSRKLTQIFIEEDKTIRADIEIEVTVFAKLIMNETNHDASIWDAEEKCYLASAADEWELDCEKTISLPFLMVIPEGIKRLSEVQPYDWGLEEISFEVGDYNVISHELKYVSI